MSTYEILARLGTPEANYNAMLASGAVQAGVDTEAFASFCPSYEEMVTFSAAVLEEVFTEEEAAELIEFYSTSLGQKVLVSQPLVVARATTFTQQYIQRALENML